MNTCLRSTLPFCRARVLWSLVCTETLPSHWIQEIPPLELAPRLEVVIRAKPRNSKNRPRTNIWAHVSQAGLLSACNSVVSDLRVIDRAILIIAADLLQTLHPLPQRGLLMLNKAVAAPELQLLHVSMYINLTVYLVHSPSYFVRVLGGSPSGGAHRGWLQDDSSVLPRSEAASTERGASLSLLFLTLSESAFSIFPTHPIMHINMLWWFKTSCEVYFNNVSAMIATDGLKGESWICNCDP